MGLAALEMAEAAAKPPRWYVAETQVRQERTAQFHLQKKGFDAYLPMRIAAPHARKIQAVAFFPRYLFVRLSIGSPGWTDIFSAIGFKALVGNGGKPLPMADSVVEIIRQHEFDGFIPLDPKSRPKTKAPYEKGEKITIKDGVMAGLSAIFEEPIDEKRVWILLSLLGRDSRVAISAASLEKRSVG